MSASKRGTRINPPAEFAAAPKSRPRLAMNARVRPRPFSVAARARPIARSCCAGIGAGPIPVKTAAAYLPAPWLLRYRAGSSDRVPFARRGWSAARASRARRRDGPTLPGPMSTHRAILIRNAQVSSAADQDREGTFRTAIRAESEPIPLRVAAVALPSANVSNADRNVSVCFTVLSPRGARP